MQLAFMQRQLGLPILSVRKYAPRLTAPLN